MKLIRTDKILGLLRNITLLVHRFKFRTDRGVNYIQKYLRGCSAAIFKGDAAEFLLCSPFHQEAYQGLRDARVHGIHRHMVTIVCGPSQCELREVTGSYNYAALLVGHIHQNLSPFACLRVLVGHICQCRILSYILEMLCHGLADRNLPCGNAQCHHQIPGVASRPAACSKAGHCHAYDAFSVPAKLVKCKHGHDQCQCAVESSRYSNDGGTAVDMRKSGRKAKGLDGHYFLASCIPFLKCLNVFQCVT